MILSLEGGGAELLQKPLQHKSFQPSTAPHLSFMSACKIWAAVSWQPVSKTHQKGKLEIGLLTIITLITAAYQSNLDRNQMLVKGAADSAVTMPKTQISEVWNKKPRWKKLWGQVREEINHLYSFTRTGNLDHDTNVLCLLRMQIKQKHDGFYWFYSLIESCAHKTVFCQSMSPKEHQTYF